MISSLFLLLPWHDFHISSNDCHFNSYRQDNQRTQFYFALSEMSFSTSNIQMRFQCKYHVNPNIFRICKQKRVCFLVAACNTADKWKINWLRQQQDKVFWLCMLFEQCLQFVYIKRMIFIQFSVSKVPTASLLLLWTNVTKTMSNTSKIISFSFVTHGKTFWNVIRGDFLPTIMFWMEWETMIKD